LSSLITPCPMMSESPMSCERSQACTLRVCCAGGRRAARECALLPPVDLQDTVLVRSGSVFVRRIGAPRAVDNELVEVASRL
jgi:hypothetical protein